MSSMPLSFLPRLVRTRPWSCGRHWLGWAGAVARIMQLFATLDAQSTLGQKKEQMLGETPGRRSKP